MSLSYWTTTTEKKKIKRKEDRRLDSENTYKSKNSIVIKMNTIFLGFHFRARKKRASNYQCSNGYGLSFIGTQHVHQELRRLRPWPSRTPRRWRPTVSFTLPALCLRMWTLPHTYLAHFTSLCYPKHYFYHSSVPKTHLAKHPLLPLNCILKEYQHPKTGIVSKTWSGVAPLRKKKKKIPSHAFPKL